MALLDIVALFCHSVAMKKPATRKGSEMFAVTRTNLRTNETKVVRSYSDHIAAETRAARSNDLARACKMTHFLYRAVYSA